MLIGMTTKSPPTLVPLRQASTALGVPVAWLRREVQAQRIPAVRVGRRCLVHLDGARETLAQRANETVARPGQRTGAGR